MLHDPDTVFVNKSIPARALALLPYSTDIVKKKDKSLDAIDVNITIEGPNFH